MSDVEWFVLGTLAGALFVTLIVAAVVSKVYLNERNRLRALKESIDQPYCGCEHHRSFHDDGGCHYIHKTNYDRNQFECGCKVYIGPPALELMP